MLLTAKNFFCDQTPQACATRHCGQLGIQRHIDGHDGNRRDGALCKQTGQGKGAGNGRAMVPQLEFEADAKEVDLERNVQV